MTVSADHETDPRSDGILKALDLRAREFKDLATTLADEVIVMCPVPIHFKAAASVECEFARKPRVLEELQRPIDSGSTDVRVTLLDQTQEVVDRHMTLGLEEDLQDGLALVAPLQAFPSEVGVQNVLLARNLLRHNGARLAFRGESRPATGTRDALENHVVTQSESLAVSHQHGQRSGWNCRATLCLLGFLVFVLLGFALLVIFLEVVDTHTFGENQFPGCRLALRVQKPFEALSKVGFTQFSDHPKPRHTFAVEKDGSRR